MLRNHPKALKILIPTEMAETYGYFSVQAILVFYLMQVLGFTDARAYAFSGQFVALAYMMPVIGGWLADRVFGNRLTVWLGGLCLLSGYAALALGHYTLFVGFALVAVGNGLLKPSISSFIGEFYKVGDPRRDAGFTLVYIGVSIGALIAMGGVGYIQKWFGWSACFAASALALLFGIGLFRWGYHYFADKGEPPHSHAKTFSALFRQKRSILMWLIALVAIVYCALKISNFGNGVVYCFGVLFYLYVAKIAWSLDRNGRRAIVALMILFAIVIFYKAMFFETYLAVNVFTDRMVDRNLFGHEIPAALFLSLPSLFSIALGPVFAKMWQSDKFNLPIIVKFGLGLLTVGLAMQLLALWVHFTPGTLLSMTSIIMFRLIFAISEFFVFPLGLAMVTEYAPRQCVSLLMGGWFLTAAYGGKLAGILAELADIPQGMTDIIQKQVIYQHAFQTYAWLDFGLFIVCLLLIPVLKRLLIKPEVCV